MVKISLCVIARDEESNIAACLESAREAADDIIVVDTGSKDNTAAIAERLGARVFYFPWCDDFSAAKNETLKHAMGDWVLALDADERLDKPGCRKIRQLLDKPQYPAYMLQLRSPYFPKKSGERINTCFSIRLFNNKIGLQYRHPLHERIDINTAAENVTQAFTNIIINHTGYQDNLREKHQRNLAISQKQSAGDDAHYCFDMARSYMGTEQYEHALSEISRGLKMPGAINWLQAQLYILLGDLLLYVKKDTEAALAAWQQAASIDNSMVSPHICLGQTFYLQKKYGAAALHFERVAELLLSGPLRCAIIDDEIPLIDAYRCLAACYLKAGRAEDAADMMVKLKTKKSEDDRLEVIPWHP